MAPCCGQRSNRTRASLPGHEAELSASLTPTRQRNPSSGGNRRRPRQPAQAHCAPQHPLSSLGVVSHHCPTPNLCKRDLHCALWLQQIQKLPHIVCSQEPKAGKNSPCSCKDEPSLATQPTLPPLSDLGPPCQLHQPPRPPVEEAGLDPPEGSGPRTLNH